MRHESIGSQDSDNTSASSEFEHEHGHDDEMDTSMSPAAPPQSRYGVLICCVMYCAVSYCAALHITVQYFAALCNFIL